MADEHRGFYFNVEKWRGSRAVGRMSFGERGVYFEMMLEQLEKQTLPDNVEEVAELIAVTDEQVAEVRAAWPAVRRKFVTDAQGRIYNVALADTRRQQRAYYLRKRKAARLGGEAKARNRRTQQGLSSSTPVAPVGSATANPAIALAKPADQIRSDQNRTEQKKAAPADARSKRPIYQSDQFVIFEWQLDDLERFLGKHVEAFDLHAFFDQLSQQARSGLLIPLDREKRWTWLQAQIEAEARRRGLPFMGAATNKPAGCRHVPPCVDAVTHTAKFMKEKAS